MIKVGITGGIATGKSLVANIIKDQKMPVIDADDIARQVVEPGEDAYLQIVEEFGLKIISQDQTLDRQKLAELVFNDSKKLAKLNQIVQPEIHQRIIEKLAEFQAKQTPIVFLEIPLLFENNYQDILDKVWVVKLGADQQLQFLIERDHLTNQQAIARIENQIPLADKIKRADVVIDNSQSRDETKQTVIKLLSEFSYEQP